MTEHNPYPFILPAEWYPQSGIELTWPHAGTDWAPYLPQITETFIELTRVIAQHEQVLIVAPDVAAVKTQLTEALPPHLLRNVVYFECDTNDTWSRDHGALTVVSTKKGRGLYVVNHLLDFKFNGWGDKFPADLDNAINLQLYFGGVFNAALTNHTDFVLEGGSIESDGKGTIFTTSSCLLAPHRNQPLTRENIDERLRIVLHARRVVWLDYGRLIGDDTDGHIDTIVRCAPADTLLYVGCDDAADEQYDDFRQLEEQLRGLRTLEGRPYRLLRLPMPDAIYDGEDRLPATYANFVILNGAVIVPTYKQPDKDRQAMETIRQAFPDREVVGIDATTVVRQHGSLHCLTMQFPENVIGPDEVARHFD